MSEKNHISKPIRALTVCTDHRSSSRYDVPLIHLSGQWLLEAGFNILSRVKVRVMHGCLVITRESDEESQSYHKLQSLLAKLKNFEKS